MNNLSKERYIEKIRKFSKVVHVFLQIAFVFSIIASVFIGIAIVSSRLPTEAVEVDGKIINAPVLFKMGETTVTMPFADTDGGDGLNFAMTGMRLFDFSGAAEGFIYTIVAIVAIGFAKRVFRLLRDNGTPFGGDVLTAVRRLAIALLILGIFGGAAGFLSAAVVWVLYLIFSYGRALQDESDSTI